MLADAEGDYGQCGNNGIDYGFPEAAVRGRGGRVGRLAARVCGRILRISAVVEPAGRRFAGNRAENERRLVRLIHRLRLVVGVQSLRYDGRLGHGDGRFLFERIVRFLRLLGYFVDPVFQTVEALFRELPGAVLGFVPFLPLGVGEAVALRFVFAHVRVLIGRFRLGFALFGGFVIDPVFVFRFVPVFTCIGLVFSEGVLRVLVNQRGVHRAGSKAGLRLRRRIGPGRVVIFIFIQYRFERKLLRVQIKHVVVVGMLKLAHTAQLLLRLGESDHCFSFSGAEPRTSALRRRPTRSGTRSAP